LFIVSFKEHKKDTVSLGKGKQCLDFDELSP
jgi:hypothetical protein